MLKLFTAFSFGIGPDNDFQKVSRLIRGGGNLVYNSIQWGVITFFFIPSCFYGRDNGYIYIQ